jgi:hypothetical protein
MTIMIITGTKMKISSAVATWPTIWMPRTFTQVSNAIKPREMSQCSHHVIFGNT